MFSRHLTLMLLLPVLLTALLATSCSRPPATLTSEQKMEDFEYLFQTIRDEYPLFGVTERQFGVRWLESYEQYREHVRQSDNDLKFAQSIRDMLLDLHQGHTHLLTPAHYAAFAGMLATLSGEEVQLIVDAMNRVLQDPTVVACYDRWAKAADVSINPSLNNILPTSNVVTRVEVPDQVAYLQIKSMVEYEQDDERIAGFLQGIRDYPYLVIDIRGNSGGSDLTWINKLVSPLLQEPITYTRHAALRGGDLGLNYWGFDRNLLPLNNLPDAPNYPPELFTDFRYAIKSAMTLASQGTGFGGKIYLLIDGGVSSASEGFAMFAKSTGWATLVGQHTGGDGGGSTPILFKLPRSGLVVRMRLEMTLNPDGSSNAEHGTTPDIVVPAGGDALSMTLQLIQSR